MVKGCSLREGQQIIFLLAFAIFPIKVCSGLKLVMIIIENINLPYYYMSVSLSLLLLMFVTKFNYIRLGYLRSFDENCVEIANLQ